MALVLLSSLCLSGCWINDATAPLVKGLRRDIHHLVSHWIDYPAQIAEHPEVNHLSHPPMLDTKLVEALALEDPMNNESIRPPIPGLARTYARNPRRAKAAIYNGKPPSEKDLPFWQSDETIKSWWYNYKYNSEVNALLQSLESEAAGITHEQWFRLLEATSPLQIKRQVPLEILREQNPVKRQAWVIKTHQAMVYEGLFKVQAEAPLSRGEHIMWAMQLTGYWDELSKTDVDEPDYTEWWASPYAEADARISCVKGWQVLNSWEKRYLTMAYSLGMLDEVLEVPPPHQADKMTHWDLSWNEPVSSKEALRTLGWIQQQQAKLQ